MWTLSHRLAPALAAAIMATNHLGSLGGGVLVFGSMLAASFALERSSHPLHLMPLASAMARATVPVAGAGLALGIFALGGSPQPVAAMMVPVGGAWLVSLFAGLASTRFARERPVRVAVIGSRGLAIGLAEELSGSGVRSHAMVGWMAGDKPTRDPGEGGPRLLGSMADLRDVVKLHQIDLLVHGSTNHSDPDEPGQSRLAVFEQVAASCLDLPVRMIEANQLYEDLLGHVPLGQSNSAWFQYLMHPRYRQGVPGAKRAFDLAVGSLMLALAAPALALFALVVKLTDGGAILYSQRRVGERGEEFNMIKLRSMSPRAEADGARWSGADDERVTRVGRLMRSLHIDELPQLWNVLRGDMTLVGPRPERRELINELELQLRFYDRRHIVKPGIAGWAQARCGYGGSEEGTGWKLCHDLYYLKHRSVYFDLMVLIENVRVSLDRGVQFELRTPQEQFILGRDAGQPTA